MKIYSVSGNRFLMSSDDIDVVKYCEDYDCDGYLKVISHQMSIYNKDNSKANLCVNGLHCFTQYLYDLNSQYKLYALVINHEVFKSEIISIDPFVSKVTLKYPKLFRNFVDVGNEHMIVLDEEKENAHIYCHRYDCNVNYVKIIDRTCIEVVTYERGVGFTKSCGSGNIASAVYCYENDLCDRNVEIINIGGKCHVHIGKDIEIISTSKRENI